MKLQLPDMIDNTIYSIRIAKFKDKVTLLIFRNKDKKFLNYSINSFIEQIIIDLESDSQDSHIRRPNFSNYDDVPSAKYSLIYNTNTYFLAKYLSLFDDKINKYYTENYDTYKEQTRKQWETEKNSF